jgi:low temperature requirement protein LtrA
MTPLWEKPRLRTAGHEVSWLELFYDLFFVVLIFGLAHRLHEVSWAAVLKFALLFVPVWWVWMVSTLYNNRFETDDTYHKVLTFVQMVPIIGLAIAVPEGLEELSRVFAGSYIAARGVLILMWMRAVRHNRGARPLARFLNIGFTFALLLWTISILVPTPERFVLWGTGLLIEVLTPLIAVARLRQELPRFSAAHLAERYALFTVIVLGETVISVVRGGAESVYPRLETGIACTLGLALAFGLGWTYFDAVRDRSAKPGLGWSVLRGYLHLPLLMGLTAVGAGVANIVGHEELVPGQANRWLICGGLAFSLVAISVIEWVTVDRSKHAVVPWSITLRFAAVAAALLLGLVGVYLNLYALLTLLVLLAASQVAPGLIQERPVLAAHESREAQRARE